MKSDDNEYFDSGDWSADESAQLASLPAERIPPEALKNRTMAALGRAHLLQPRRTSSTGRIVAFLAAASVFFIAGAVIGYAAGRRAAPTDTQARVPTGQEVAQANSVAVNSPQTRHIVWY